MPITRLFPAIWRHSSPAEWFLSEHESEWEVTAPATRSSSEHSQRCKKNTALYLLSCYNETFRNQSILGTSHSRDVIAESESLNSYGPNSD